jgi:asparagine synthase (glutamine-hydrolysing)
MCGIVGIIKKTGIIGQIEFDTVQKALKAQAHRGPDASSFWADQKVILGHNRLSIIDLSTSANQPFHRDDLGLVIIFNGEIYNYKVIKDELLKLGALFNTSSDTEVLLLAFHYFGESFLKKLVGMFAFLIYNKNSGEIFMARDRYGEKPLFFIETAQALYFASELQALKQIYPESMTINQEAVIDLLEQMYINGHHTIYEEVKVFQPARSLSSKNGQFCWNVYYKFPTKVDLDITFPDLKREVNELLVDSVTAELHADVPVATFLSSGIDSSLITAIAKGIKSDILAITMSTGDPSTDEVTQASVFAKKLGINQEVVTISTKSLEVLVRLMKNIQPLADASIIPTHLVTQQVSSHTKVMLSGDAGDEVFGSYRKPVLFSENAQYLSSFPSNLLNSALSQFPKISAKYLTDKNRFRLAGWEGFYAKTNLSGVFNKVLIGSKPINSVLNKAKELENLYQENPEKLSFGVDMETRLPSDFLFKVDTASMASSLEVRAPFLDHRLVDLSFRSSIGALMPSGKDKEITRTLYKEYAGYEHQGSKKGFSLPYSTYLQHDWGLILESFLNEGISETYFHFNRDGIIEILKKHRKSPQQKWARILYSVLVLEIWLRVFHLNKEVNLFSI